MSNIIQISVNMADAKESDRKMTDSCQRLCSGNLLEDFLLLAPCPPPNSEDLFWSEVDRLGLQDTEIKVIVENCQIRYRSVTSTYPLSKVIATTASTDVTRITTVQDSFPVNQSTVATVFKNITDVTTGKENLHATSAVINKAVPKPGNTLLNTESTCEQSCVYGIISALCILVVLIVILIVILNQRRIRRKHRNRTSVIEPNRGTEEEPSMPNHIADCETHMSVRSIEEEFFDGNRESPRSDCNLILLKTMDVAPKPQSCSMLYDPQF
ncbi:hypothetical protein CHS0354_042685 [Potamilus streckersoni]|uniref:Uncharacterized protein n=1 Tax=Potamilus streckersoni TaxID=2493646 RepID=A0AAE0VRQ6_9BIVA|nr:hypothetical protein CHS0354_042685 [Potamilus streckersoni]